MSVTGIALSTGCRKITFRTQGYRTYREITRATGQLKGGSKNCVESKLAAPLAVRDSIGA